MIINPHKTKQLLKSFAALAIKVVFVWVILLLFAT
jgi:hypothetical protein